MKKHLSFFLAIVLIIVPTIGTSYSNNVGADSDISSSSESIQPTGLDDSEETKDSRGVDFWVPYPPSRTLSEPQGGFRGGNDWDVNLIKFPNSYSYVIYPVITVENNSGQANTLHLVIACYDVDNRLTGCTSTSIFIDDGAIETISVKYIKPYSTRSCKSFLWDQNQVPICTEFTFFSNATDEIGKPQDLAVITKTDTTVSLSWSRVCGATNYNVEYNGNIISVGRVNSATIKGLTQHTAYTFKVRSFDNDFVSVWSDPLNVSTLYSAPTGFTVVSTSKTGIDLSWDDLPNATSYDLLISEAVSATGSGITQSLGNVTSAAVSGLTPGTIYFLRVRGIIGSEASTWSDIVMAITDADGNLPKGPFTSSVKVNAVIGDNYEIAVSASFMSEHSGKEVTMEYDAAVFIPATFSTQSNITFVKVSPGAIKFIPAITVTEGAVELLSLSALKTTGSAVRMYSNQ